MNPDPDRPPELSAKQLHRLRSVISGVPEAIGPYKLGPIIGEGGFGVVYRAEQHEPMKRSVAIKLIRPGMDSEQVLRRFDMERETLAGMSHPGIARILDAGTTEAGRPYFVMELVEGTPLTTYCDEHRLPTADRIELFLQVLDAIDHAHRRGVIHRDLKPSNVLVCDVDGRAVVKVIDFGIAKALRGTRDGASVLTLPGQGLVGTPEYMAPEQTRLDGEGVDVRTDVYALGVLLYELFTGRVPLEQVTLHRAAYDEVCRIIREEDPPRPSEVLRSSDAADVVRRHATQPATLIRLLRGELEWIPLKALRKLPAHRYRSVAEMGDDIRNYQAGRALLAGPESSWYRASKVVARHRVATLASVAVAVSLVAGLGVSLWLAGRAERARAEAARQSEIAASERASAEAINAFLLTLLRSAAPEQARGRDVSVREVVERALGALDGRFEDQPRVRIRLGVELSDLLDALGRTPEAEPYVRRAFEEARQTLGADDELTLMAMNELAGISAEVGKLDESEQLYRQLIERSQRVYGPEHRNTLTAINDLAITLEKLGRLGESADLHREALDKRRAFLGPDHPDTVSTKSNLGSMLSSLGQHDEAIRLCSEAFEDNTRTLGADHPTTLHAATALANAYWEADRLDDAGRLHRSTLATRSRVLGEDHPDTLASLSNLALVIDNQGDYAEAEQLFDRAATRYAELFGPEHPHAIATRANRATSLEGLKRFDEAAAIYVELQPILDRVLGPAHPYASGNLGNLGTLYETLGRLDEAEAVLVDAVRRSEAGLGDDHPQTLQMRSALERVRNARK